MNLDYRLREEKKSYVHLQRQCVPSVTVKMAKNIRNIKSAQNAHKFPKKSQKYRWKTKNRCQLDPSRQCHPGLSQIPGIYPNIGLKEQKKKKARNGQNYRNKKILYSKIFPQRIFFPDFFPVHLLYPKLFLGTVISWWYDWNRIASFKNFKQKIQYFSDQNMIEGIPQY